MPVWSDERHHIYITYTAHIIGLNSLGVVNANTAADKKYVLDEKGRRTDAMINAEKSKDMMKRWPPANSRLTVTAFCLSHHIPCVISVPTPRNIHKRIRPLSDVTSYDGIQKQQRHHAPPRPASQESHARRACLIWTPLLKMVLETGGYYSLVNVWK